MPKLMLSASSHTSSHQDVQAVEIQRVYGSTFKITIHSRNGGRATVFEDTAGKLDRVKVEMGGDVVIVGKKFIHTF